MNNFIKEKLETIPEERQKVLLKNLNKNSQKLTCKDNNKTFTGKTNQQISLPINYNNFNMKSNVFLDSSELIYTEDNRVLVDNNNIFPYSCIGIVDWTYLYNDETLKTYSTGVLISAYCAITAVKSDFVREYGKYV